MKKRMTIGIDYSLTSPAITECYGEWNQKNITYYCLAQNPRQYERWSNFPRIQLTKYPKYNTEMQRYQGLATWVSDCIVKHNRRPQTVYIEDYAFAATGRVFHIAENMAILKHTLTSWGIKYEMIPPTVIKKYASGKGNAKKEMMYESFVNDTQRNLINEFEINPDKNPISDIVDSYWICKYGYEHGTNT